MLHFGLYWRNWSRLMMISEDNSNGDWGFEKSAIDSPSDDVGVDAELEMVTFADVRGSHIVLRSVDR